MVNLMNFNDEDAETAVAYALGAASVCWDDNRVFLSDRAAEIGRELIDHLRKLRLIPEESTTRCGICYRALDTEWGQKLHTRFADDSVRCFAEPDRAYGNYISGFAFEVQAYNDRRKMAEKAEKERQREERVEKCKCFPHGPDEPCTCDGCWACTGHVVGCTCDIAWNCEHEPGVERGGD